MTPEERDELIATGKAQLDRMVAQLGGPEELTRRYPGWQATIFEDGRCCIRTRDGFEIFELDGHLVGATTREGIAHYVAWGPDGEVTTGAAALPGSQN